MSFIKQRQSPCASWVEFTFHVVCIFMKELYRLHEDDEYAGLSRFVRRFDWEGANVAVYTLDIRFPVIFWWYISRVSGYRSLGRHQSYQLHRRPPCSCDVSVRSVWVTGLCFGDIPTFEVTFCSLAFLRFFQYFILCPSITKEDRFSTSIQ